MKIDRISLKNKAVTYDERQGANHLAEQQSRRMHSRSARLHEYRCLSRTVRASDDANAAQKSHPVFDLELIYEDDGNAKYSNDNGNYLPRRYTFTWQKYPGKQQTKNGNSSLQDRSESRGDILLRPKDRAVVQAELKKTGQSQQSPFGNGFWKRYFLSTNYRKNDNDRKNKSRRSECDRWQIAEADLDEDPCRAPDQAEYEPNQYSLHTYDQALS